MAQGFRLIWRNVEQIRSRVQRESGLIG